MNNSPDKNSTAAPVRIGTRGSQLALWQANTIRDQLDALGENCEIKIIKTQGDRIDNVPFSKLEGKGFFTKELEEALLAEEVDLAVHSLKDLTTDMPSGLALAALVGAAATLGQGFCRAVLSQGLAFDMAAARMKSTWPPKPE